MQRHACGGALSQRCKTALVPDTGSVAADWGPLLKIASYVTHWKEPAAATSRTVTRVGAPGFPGSLQGCWAALAGVAGLSLLFALPLPAAPLVHATRARVGVSAVQTSSVEDRTPVLKTVRSIRSLDAPSAARGLPVHVTGVVTAFSGYKTSFFFSDGTGGISIDRLDSAEVHTNDIVSVIGRTNPALFAPSVDAMEIRVLGHGRPPAPLAVTWSDLAGGASDSQWIEIEGVVHSAARTKVFGHEMFEFHIDHDGQTLQVLLADSSGLDPARLVDARVRFRGVCESTFNEKRQFVSPTLLVPGRADIEVLQAAPEDAFALPTTPIRSTLQYGRSPHRVKIEGVVTLQWPGRAVYVQEGEDGIRVQTSSREPVAVGSRVEALGFPVMGEYAPELADGSFRVIGPGAPIAPLPIRARAVIQMNGAFLDVPYDDQLVQLRGKLVEHHLQRESHVLTMQEDDGAVFEARMPRAFKLPQMVENGAVLRLTGICAVHTDTEHKPISFSLLLRGPDDILVLKRNPWWTPAHALVVLSGALGTTLVVVLWVVLLRARVQQQTRVIRESEIRFRHLAEHDALTGLPNRLVLEEVLGQKIRECAQTGRMAAVFTLDVDRFKHINDLYGHTVADACLKAAAERLRQHVRHTDLVARTGGEEFTVIAAGLPDDKAAQRIAGSLLTLFDKPILLTELEIKITVSIGVALFPGDGKEIEILRRRADQALFEAKRTGRNRAVFATEEIAASSEEAIHIENALRESLESSRFVLFYQPIFDANGAIRRFEALIRATDERLRLAGPAKFIPIAEECGLVVPLGRWVLNEACRQVGAWRALGIADCPVNVNVSARQLLQPSFADEVATLMDRYAIAPSMVELELTETAVMTEPGALAETVTLLADAGHSFAIDDFGTGYSSLARLRELPIQTLKIDRSFVMNLGQKDGSDSIILAIVQMAKSLGLEIVAEGVETREQFEILRDLGCDFFQGYLFARPLTADGAIEALQENRARLLTPVASA